MAKDKRFHLWNEGSGSGELISKIQDLVGIATKLNIIKPIIVT